MIKRFLLYTVFGLMGAISAPMEAICQQTYAEKLGFDKNDKVLIIHVDDLGMSYSSNTGGLKAISEGLANSGSMMMPCAWIPDLFKRAEKVKDLDLGLHLTLTSEWDTYRWGPVIGTGGGPSLVDKEGKLYKTVDEVVENASLSEVEKELRAQIELSRTMGIVPTHLDSHMGTLFANPDYMALYVRLGIEYRIPVMVPAGHNTLVSAGISPELKEQVRLIGEQLWDAGLPVIDDLLNESYDWRLPDGVEPTHENLMEYKTNKYMEAFSRVQPGITYVITHCSDPSDIFGEITDSGDTRKGDMLAMLDPRLKAYIEKEKFVLVTWRELMERRKKVK